MTFMGIKKDSLYVVIPAYNEAENLEQVVSDWYPVVEKAGGFATCCYR